MANLTNGSDLLIFIGSGSTATPIAHSRSCSISFNTSLADITTKNNQGFSEVMPTIRSWEISNDALVAWGENVQLFMQAFMNKTPLTVSYKPLSILSGSTYYSGTAYLESLEISAEMEDAATFSVNLKGTGALVPLTV